MEFLRGTNKFLMPYEVNRDFCNFLLIPRRSIVRQGFIHCTLGLYNTPTAAVDVEIANDHSRVCRRPNQPALPCVAKQSISRSTPSLARLCFFPPGMNNSGLDLRPSELPSLCASFFVLELTDERHPQRYNQKRNIASMRDGKPLRASSCFCQLP